MRWLMVVVPAVMLATLAPVDVRDASAGVVEPPVAEAATDAAALAAAQRSGQRVEVASARSELTQVFAEPSGHFTLESAVVPQRARRVDGSWAPVDLTLQRDGVGLWRPAVSVADVRFSGGGSGPLVTLVRAGKTLALSWPGVLPVPSVSGESATYAGVLPDVDLVVRATWTGFSHVLVVKTPAAASNAAVRQIRLRLGGDAQVSALPGGGLRASAGGVLLAAAQPAVMWDSRPVPRTAATRGSAARQVAGSAGEGSSPVGPGDAARIGEVRTEVTAAGELLLTPDPELLAGDATAFPVFVDPAWSTAKSRWAYAASNNVTNSDATKAWVGLNPVTGARFRSYFDFPISAIRGKHIESSYVQMKLDHSWSCGNTTTHMYNTSGIATTPRTRWAPTNKKWMASADSHANEDDGCPDSPQNDMIVNFIHSSVTSTIQDHATKNGTLITIGFCACNADGQHESTQNRWKKFFPQDAKLIVDFSSYPGKPTGLQVAGISCPATGRVSIGTLTPTLSAVYPDADSTQALRASYEWLEIPASGVYNEATPRKPAPGTRSVPAGGRTTSAALTGVVAGKAYAWRTQATDPAPYNLPSLWSAWCEFTVDTTVPSAPTISVASLPAGPGKPGTFTITSTDSDVTRFRYGWTSPPLTEVTATGTTTKTATVTVTAPRYGQNVLYAYAIDATANKGNDATYEFLVGRPSPPAAQWGLETHPGVDQAAALADQQPSLAGNTPLAAANLAWSGDVRLVGGQTASFNGTTSLAEVPSATVDTSKPFAVSAWVRVRNITSFHAIASKDGSTGQWSTFRLQLRPAGGSTPARWCLTSAKSLTATTGTVHTCSPATPVANRWTHIAATYSPVEGTTSIWVDGQRTDATFTGGLNSTGAVVIGRAVNAGSPVDWLNGHLADIQVFDRVLVEHDLIGQLASDPDSGGVDEPGMRGPVEVGRWDFEDAVSCYDTSIAGTCQTSDASDWRRRLALSRGIDAGLGRSGGGLALDSVHWVEDPADPYYGQVTREYGWSQRNTAAAGQPEQWQNTPVLRTDQSFTVSAWVMVETPPTTFSTVVAQDGTDVSGFYLGVRNVSGVRHWAFMLKDSDSSAATSRFAMSAEPITDDDVGRWIHLVGVYDAQRHHIRLYLDGTLQGAPVARPVAPWHAAGSLTVGRAWYQATDADPFIGNVDDVSVYQGALTDAAVSLLHETQSASASS